MYGRATPKFLRVLGRLCNELNVVGFRVFFCCFGDLRVMSAHHEVWHFMEIGWALCQHGFSLEITIAGFVSGLSLASHGCVYLGCLLLG